MAKRNETSRNPTACNNSVDHMFIDGIAKEIQANIQKQLNELLKIRTSPFHKWDLTTVNEYYTQFE